MVGGFYERMVRSVKTCLKLSVGRESLPYEELRTVLTEIEGIINSRPLTFLSNDANDLSPLTPNDIIGSNSGICLPMSSNYDNRKIDCERKDLIKIWKTREKFKMKFWNRWHSDYLHQLRSINLSKGGKSKYLKIGDVVIIEDANQPRLLWKLGIVEESFMGRDGRVRSCQLKLGSGVRLRRPIQHLYPLEVDHFGAEDVK